MTKRQPRYKKGDRIGGRFLVHQALMGGMGEVYLCLDEQENYPIALKTFQQRSLLDQHTELQASFEREVRIWIDLGYHPNVVFCMWMHRLDSQPFMALEWVAAAEGHGLSLRDWLREGALREQQAADFALDVCRGLSFAGQKFTNFVHRDLKPENILIDYDQRARITDLGLASVTRHHLEAAPDPAQRIAGTPVYMAPEQWLGTSKLDERTDMYAVGCILYEMQTGKPLFRANTLAGLHDQHLRAVPNLDAVHAAWRPLLRTCLEKDRDRRFAGLSDLTDAINQVYQQRFDQSPHSAANAPTLDTDYVSRGITYTELGLYERALDDFQQAITLDSQDTGAYINRANTYAAMKRYPPALADLNQAQRLAPSSVEAHITRSKVYLGMAQYRDGIADCDRALKLDPRNPAAYYNRGSAYHFLGQEKQALQDLSKAIQINPRLKEAYGNRAIVYATLKQYEAALADWKMALELDPYHVLSWTERAKAYAELKRYDEALRDFDEALRLAPEDAETYFNRGVTHLAMQHLEAALLDWAQALDIDDSYAQAHYNIGVTMFKSGAFHEALGYLERAKSGRIRQAEGHIQTIREIFERFGEQITVEEAAVVICFNSPSLEALRESTIYIPFMTEEGFLTSLEAFIQQFDRRERQPMEQRLAWLRQIASGK